VEPATATEIFARLRQALDADDREAALGALRAGYELLNRDGVSAWLALFHPEIEWSEGTEAPDRRIYRGREGVLRQQEEFEAAWESFRMEPVDYVAAGDRLAVIVEAWGRGRGSGAEVEARLAHLFETRNDMIVRFLVFGDTAKAIEAVRSG
jgi:ketosteroid isomerase-like protein